VFERKKTSETQGGDRGGGERTVTQGRGVFSDPKSKGRRHKRKKTGGLKIS